jgi:PhzF family phenazine biosynthesis protein
MKPRAFLQLDVFTDKPYYGNALAVILNAEDLDTAAMQRIANWTNLSETIFLLPPTTPQADYRVRIFTPASELPFAGHPSVGAAYAVLVSGRVDGNKRELVQECAAGLLPVRVEGGGTERLIHVQAPDARFAPADPALAPLLKEALGVAPVAAPRNICNGPWWLTADLGEAAVVRGLKPDLAKVAEATRRHGAVGLTVFGREHSGDAAYAVRAFCPADGIPEDPVTGSANAVIGAYLHATDPAYARGGRYRASQGREVGRDGVVEVTVSADGRTSIGGRCVICVEGTLLA